MVQGIPYVHPASPQIFASGHSKPELFVADPRGYGHIMNIMAEELGIKAKKY
jgi:hypothetical protein